MKKIMTGFLVLGLAACQGDDLAELDGVVSTQEREALAGTQWVLKYSQSDIGLKEPLTGMFTVTFHNETDIEVSHQCGSSMTTYSIGGSVTSEGGALMNIASENFLEEYPCDVSELVNYQHQLLNITGYELTGDTLILKEGERDSLLLARRFTMCDSPASLTGNASEDFFAPAKVWLTLADDAPAGVVAQFDQQFPDFMLLPSDQCDARILASMNRNTLDMLRCNEAIATISFQN